MGVRTPSYQAGFYAPERGGRAAYPQLWRGCVGAWNPGIGPSGLVLRDWSGRKNNGTLTNGPVWSTSTGRQALSLDGVNDYIAFPLRSLVTNNFTLSGWFSTASNSYQYLLAMEGAISPSSGWELLRVDIQANRLVSGYVFTGSSNFIGATAVPMNVWSHVSFSRSGNVFSLYVNGMLTGSATYSPSTIAATAGINDIGARRNSPSTLAFSGSVSDVLIHDRALPLSAIKLLAQRPGIAYELAPRRYYSLPPSSARLRRILTGAT